MKHDHVFNQHLKRPGETRTLAVIIITAVTMVLEISVGILSGSMALLADGLHMASHASALGINLFAYRYARRHAQDPRFSFGTGKVNALGGFSGALLLAGIALLMAWESAERLSAPVEIHYEQAILVAVLGLVINGASVFILQENNGRHGHEHPDHQHPSHFHDHPHHDHNLRSAYLHVLADALTSLLAILALLCAKFLNWVWMDPLMGFTGALLVSRWAFGLLKTTTAVLLDHQGPADLQKFIREKIEKNGRAQIHDLHLWSVGPDIFSVIVSLSAANPQDAELYKSLISQDPRLVHITVEITVPKISDLRR